jgi:hypothetical protein
MAEQYNIEVCNSFKNIRDHFNRIARNKLKKTNVNNFVNPEDNLTLDNQKFQRLDTGPGDENRVILFISNFFLI